MQDFLIFVSEQWILFSALVLILALMVINSKAPKNEISSLNAVKLMNTYKVAIFDIRSDTEFRQSHIIKAKNIELKEIDLNKIEDDFILIYGNESSKLIKQANASFKKSEHNSKVRILSMGLSDWIKEDFPVVSGKS